MKEFKFDVNGIAIPIVNCETQIEFTKAVSSFRYSGGKLGVEAHEDEYVCNIYIIYKDGTCYYHNGVDKDEGKYKRTGIKSGIITDDNSAIVFGSFAINEYGNISIDESDIEEYGVYAGQYDVKEQDEQEVQETVEHTETETNETTAETTAEQETVEGISKTETTPLIIHDGTTSVRAIKKYVIKYRSTPTSEWEILRNSGSVITTAENETDAKKWAICELADRLHSKARKNARDKANDIRCYELADQYPDWHEFYKQVKEYDWLIEDWQG